MAFHKQVSLGRYAAFLTIDPDYLQKPIGIGIAHGEIAVSVRLSPQETQDFAQVAAASDCKLIHFCQTVETIEFEITMNADERSELAAILLLLCSKYADMISQIAEGETKQ